MHSTFGGTDNPDMAPLHAHASPANPHIEFHTPGPAATQTPSAEPPTPPHLMGLTAELRNKIFEPLLAEAATLRRVTVNSKGTSFKHGEPALLAVHPQLRKEYLTLYIHLVSEVADEIVAKVHNFEFTALITYLDTLHSTQRRAITAKRSLRIQLTLDRKLPRSAWHALSGWLRYCSRDLPVEEQVTRTTPTYRQRSSVYSFEGEVANMDSANGSLYSSKGFLDRDAPRARMQAEWEDIFMEWKLHFESMKTAKAGE